jgi:hypothetical protein
MVRPFSSLDNGSNDKMVVFNDDNDVHPSVSDLPPELDAPITPIACWTGYTLTAAHGMAVRRFFCEFSGLMAGPSDRMARHAAEQ